MKLQKKYSGNFTVLDNTVLEDAALSLQAKGLFAYLWHLPDNWNFREREIEKHSTNGKDSTVKARKELETKGYLVRTRKRVHGKFHDIQWTLVEKPISPRAGNPPSVYPPSEKPQLQNTNKQNTNKQNTKSINNLSLTPSSEKLSTDSSDKTEQPKREINDKPKKPKRKQPKPLTQKQVDIVKQVRALFAQWGFTISENENGMLVRFAQKYPPSLVIKNAQTALGLADTYPFGYFVKMMQNEDKME